MQKLSFTALCLAITGFAASHADAQWTVAGANIYYTAGRVGIGTSNPGYPLEVRGAAQRAIYSYNTSTSGTVYGVYGLTKSTAGRGLFGWANASSGTTYGVFGQASSTAGRGVHGVNTATSGTNYGVFGQVASTSGRAIYGEANSTSGTNYGVYGRTNSRNGFGVYGLNNATSGGAIGILGKTNSSAGWGVYGEADAGTAVHGVSDSGIAVSGHVTDDDAHAAYFTGGRSYFEGNVGVGTDNPVEALDVHGNIMLRTEDRLYFGAPSENTDPIYFIREPNGGGSTLITLVLGNDPDANANADWFVISTRNVNGTSNTDRFYFSSYGAAFKPGGGSWTSLSDARMKKDVAPLTDSLETLLQLRGVQFEYTDTNAIGAAPGLRTGFIAQEVEAVIPQWVGEAKGYKTLEISGFEAMAVEALRELRAEKDAQIEALRSEKNAEIDELRTRLERLEALLLSSASQASAD